jgi:hypothetical protein
VSKTKTLIGCVTTLLQNPLKSARSLSSLTEQVRGAEFARQPGVHARSTFPVSPESKFQADEAANPLRTYFDGVKEGPGVWKWLHYFEIYHRHLQKFVGRPVTIVEVGVYSGGSMPMWRSYFGSGCHVHGVDIQEECKAYEDSSTTIHIGDQSDRDFWKRLREAVPVVDILIDDGGHTPEQQMVTLEEMLPHLNPGGVYVCEDVHGARNGFATFAHSLAGELNATNGTSQLINTTPFQAVIHSVHLYPFVVVIEKRAAAVATFSAPKHGTKWQPFL